MLVSRRKLLVTMAGAIALPAAYYGAQPFLSKQNIAGYIPAELYAADLGRHYLDTLLKDATAPALEKELLQRLPWYYRVAPRLALQRAAENDYFHGDVLEADGWVLPRTTVVVCALAALKDAHVH